MQIEPAPQLETPQRQVVYVYNLVEFVLQVGDITPGGFQKRDRAQAGTQGYKQVQRSSPAGYQAEVEIAHQVEGATPLLEVRGRMDGLYANAEPVIIEEIKTTTLSLDLVNEAYNHLHWAQTQCYAFMYARQQNLSGVRIHLTYYHQISTKYAQRADSYAAIAEVIETTCRAHAGNYLVYFPSYAYLAAVLELLKERLSDKQLLVQDRAMTETEREAFLDRFSAGNQETLVGLAVMGGIFGEGIDLVGKRLIGVIVVGVGVPQIGLERDLIKEYFYQQNGRGFAYAYQYPGFNRVLQATGRVIRTETDRGVIILVDERFTHTRYRHLFPAHWRNYQVVSTANEVKDKLMRFWSRA